MRKPESSTLFEGLKTQATIFLVVGTLGFLTACTSLTPGREIIGSPEATSAAQRATATQEFHLNATATQALIERNQIVQTTATALALAPSVVLNPDIEASTIRFYPKNTFNPEDPTNKLGCSGVILDTAQTNTDANLATPEGVDAVMALIGHCGHRANQMEIETHDKTMRLVGTVTDTYVNTQYPNSENDPVVFAKLHFPPEYAAITKYDHDIQFASLELWGLWDIVQSCGFPQATHLGVHQLTTDMVCQTSYITDTNYDNFVITSEEISHGNSGQPVGTKDGIVCLESQYQTYETDNRGYCARPDDHANTIVQALLHTQDTVISPYAQNYRSFYEKSLLTPQP